MNRKQIIAALWRRVEFFFGLVVPVAVQAIGLPGLDVSVSARTKWVLTLTSMLLAVVAHYRKQLLDGLNRLLARKSSDFATVTWPIEAPKLPGRAQLLEKVWRMMSNRSHDLLRAIEISSEHKELAFLPQQFELYKSIPEFWQKNDVGLLAGVPAALARELPALGKDAVVAIVGAAGSGKSYSLLRQVARHMQQPYEDYKAVTEVTKTRLVLPIYLDLASWRKLGDPGGDHRLERWACAFIRQAYTDAKQAPQNTIKQEEATWLLHSPDKAAVRVVLCLDGLDELPAAYRQPCLEAILDYQAAGGNVVFTCRRKELVDLMRALTPAHQETDCWVYDLPDFTTPEQLEEAIIRHKLGATYAQPAALADLSPAVRRDVCQRATPLIECLHQYRMYEYLNAPLLVNLFVEVFPTLDARLLETPAVGRYPASVLWNEYEWRQWQRREEYEADFGKDFWPAFRTSLYHVAVQAGSNSFTIDTIQPAVWLGRPLAAPDPPNEATADALPAEATPPTSQLALTRQLRWYYFTSRLLVGVVLAAAAGALMAGPTAFLGDGVLVGGLTAQFTMWRNYRAEAAPTPTAWWQRSYAWQVLCFVAVLMLVCGCYEGFKVPRRPGDMQLGDLFSITQALCGLAVGLIAGTVLGFRRIHTRDRDISLVEQLGLKWLEALWVGLLVGWVGVGAVVGLLAAGLVHWFPTDTLGAWLLPALPAWQQHLPLYALTASPAWADGLAALALGFTVGGAVGCVLVTLLALLDRQHSMLEDGERNKILDKPYGLRQSGRHGWRIGILVGLLVVAVLCSAAALTDGQYLGRLTHYASMGLGAALVAFLWFGGVELIQHYTLRLYLALWQQLPLDFNQWLRLARELAFVLPAAGPALKFRHDTLLHYLQLQPGTVAVARPTDPLPPLALPPAARREWRLFRGLLLLGALGLVGVPLLQRYVLGSFWPHANAFDLQPAPGVQVLNDSTITVQRAGWLRVVVTGRVHVGDIVGSVGPQGAAYGFLGIDLQHFYDRFRTANHGALFYRVRRPMGQGNTPWCPLLPVATPLLTHPWQQWQATLPEAIHPGEQVQFAINDAEWQNNSGRFHLAFDTRARH